MITQALTLTFAAAFIALGIAALLGKLRLNPTRARLAGPIYLPIGLLFVVSAFETDLTGGLGLPEDYSWLLYVPLFLWVLYWILRPPAGSATAAVNQLPTKARSSARRRKK